MKVFYFPVLAIPSSGKSVIIKPGNDYEFPNAEWVKEIKLK